MVISAIILILAFIYGLHVQLPNFGLEPLNYLFRSFFHANPQHLVANSVSLLNLRPVSKVLNQTQILQVTILIWILSSLILYLIHSIFPQQKRIAIGFSGVIFGLVIVTQYLSTGKLFNVTLNNLITIIPHFFIPGISFLGHLSGILAGIVAVFMLPIFQ